MSRFNENEKPQESPKTPKDINITLENYLKNTSDDEFIRELLMTNAMLERLVVEQLKRNIELENQLEQKNNPFFYFNKN